jgi:hypothetical protein
MLQEKPVNPGCQMVCFQTKPPVLAHFWEPFEWKISIYFMIIWYTLWPFALFHGTFWYMYCVKKNLATLNRSLGVPFVLGLEIGVLPRYIERGCILKIGKGFLSFFIILYTLHTYVLPLKFKYYP